MRALPALIASVALAATACAADRAGATPESSTPDTRSPNDSTGDSNTGAGGGGAGRHPRALTSFSDCSAFLDHVKAEASNRVGPYGLGDDPWSYWLEGDVVRAETTAEMAVDDGGDFDTAGDAAQPASAENEAGDFTTTNVQELGVDEPDIIKTDGERILVVSENRLTHIDATDEPTITDSIVIEDGWGHELFIRGDRALLFTNGGHWGYPMPVDVEAQTDAEAEFASDEAMIGIAPDHFGPATMIIDVDLSDPTDLEIVATMRIEGQYLSARAIGDRVRVAVTSPPNDLPWLFPQSQTGHERAEQANREIIEESTLDDWLPSYELVTTSGTSTTGNLLRCDQANHPAEFSGFDMVSIVDLDISSGLGSVADGFDAVGVMASGQSVYSSTDRMYVATTKWAGSDMGGDDDVRREWNEEYETDLHAFALADDEATTYAASGTIAGSLLNQFSLDEHDGFLRAITTAGSPWSQSGESETHLVVFQEQGNELVAVGEVGGLGRGEQLYSARLMGDIGFAVTFRQIDPFYVLDLSDPFDPRIAGELKIPGFSTYLHPVGEDHVLGLGQAATEEGRTTGLKLSLFDVSDPTDPREVAVWTEPNANSPAEWDHRAFQMFGSTAIVPVQSWTGDFNGAVVFDIDDDITEVGRVSHTPFDSDPWSECRKIREGDLTPDSSELYWMVQEGHSHVQICQPDDAGGWGDWPCERIPVDQLAGWFYDSDIAETDLAAIGARPDDVVEMCWPDGGYQEAIQRSLVIDDAIWTLAPSMLQANALDGLDAITQISLR